MSTVATQSPEARADRPSPIAPTAHWIETPTIEPYTIGVALSSDGHTIYTITRDGDAYACMCEGNATWGRTCRHIKALAAQVPVAAKAAPRPFLCIKCGQVPAHGAGLLCECCAYSEHSCADAPVEIAPSTEEDVALSAAIKSEVLAELAGFGPVTMEYGQQDVAGFFAASSRALAAAHTFEPGSTRLVLANDPFAGAGY